MRKKKVWLTAPISPTCETLRGPSHCGRPTAYAYKAYGGGWMALCDYHAEPHLAIAKPLKALLAKGETLQP